MDDFERNCLSGAFLDGPSNYLRHVASGLASESGATKTADPPTGLSTNGFKGILAGLNA
jgi:hypothetical protein